MTITYTIDETEKLAYVTFPEQATLTAALETMQALAADPRLGRDFGVLVDLRAFKPVPTAQEARDIVTTATGHDMFLPNPTALVVGTLVQLGMGNMISIIAGLRGAKVKPFQQITEAKRWLHLQVHRE